MGAELDAKLEGKKKNLQLAENVCIKKIPKRKGNGLALRNARGHSQVPYGTELAYKPI